MTFSKTKTTLALCILALLSFTSSNSEVTASSEVRSKLLTLFPNATAVEWEIERGKYEAEFTVNGLDVEITFDSKANVISMEEEILYSNFPENIRNAFEKNKSSYKITKAMRLKNYEKTQFSLIALFPGSREYYLFAENGSVLSHKVMAKDKPARNNTKTTESVPDNITKWDLPVILSEVSAIALLNSNVMACVQDELGSIFLFDMSKNLIISEIEFAGAGDYEGLAIVNTTAYVLRSDGTIYEVSDFQSSSVKVKEYKINLPKSTQNFEGLCYDSKSNRLLIAPRTFDSDDTNMKGIYAFNLSKKEFSGKPVFTINLTNPVFNAVKKTGKNEVFIPSEIAIHPVTGDMYISDARNKLLLVTNSDGDIKSLHPLNRNSFPKTEGIAISKEGQIYLSNEGKKSLPNILKLSADKLR